MSYCRRDGTVHIAPEDEAPLEEAALKEAPTTNKVAIPDDEAPSEEASSKNTHLEDAPIVREEATTTVSEMSTETLASSSTSESQETLTDATESAPSTSLEAASAGAESAQNDEFNIDDEKEGFIKEDGSIDWNCPVCPAMQFFISSPCAEEFKTSFQCFHDTQQGKKEIEDCYAEMKGFQDCTVKNRDFFGDFSEGPENEPELSPEELNQIDSEIVEKAEQVIEKDIAEEIEELKVEDLAGESEQETNSTHASAS